MSVSNFKKRCSLIFVLRASRSLPCSSGGAYLAKPPKPEELERAITIALARHSDLMELRRLNNELEQALGEVKKLRGILPICSNCKKIRDDQGYWKQIETYIREHSEADFSHGICPDCLNELSPEFNH